MASNGELAARFLRIAERISDPTVLFFAIVTLTYLFPKAPLSRSRERTLVQKAVGHGLGSNLAKAIRSIQSNPLTGQFVSHESSIAGIDALLYTRANIKRVGARQSPARRR